MHLFFNILGLHIPGYGLMIALGVVIANLIAFYLIRHYTLDSNDLLILEGYTFLGAFLGAKLLYLLISIPQINWSRITDLNYFNTLMQGGFVFYGGLIGGLLSLLFAGKVHTINYKPYIQHLIFLIPLIHGFGRIGCFMAGCCYGMPYNGIFAVTFPVNSMAPSEFSLFPVQLIEATTLFVLALIIFLLDFHKKTVHSIAIYFIGYSIIRFILEFARYDTERGLFLIFSTSQWISILLFISGICYFVKKRYQ